MIREALSPERIVYDLVALGDPRVSPDGQRLLYSAGRSDRDSGATTSHLWLCNIDGSDPRQLTRGGGRNSGGRWSPDGRQIAFISDRGEGSGIYLLPVDGPGEAWEMARHPHAISDIAWSPDGNRIAYTALTDPEPEAGTDKQDGPTANVRVIRRLDYKQDTRGHLGERRTHVYIVDSSGGTPRQITSGAQDYQTPAWSGDGALLAARVQYDVVRSRLALLEPEGGVLREIGPEQGAIKVWSWSPSGAKLLFAGDPETSYHADFFLYDRAGDSVRQLTDNLHCLPDGGFQPIVPPAQPVWPDEDRALFHAHARGASELWEIDTNRGAIHLLTSLQALNSGLSADSAVTVIAQTHTSLQGTGEISVTDVSTGETGIVTAANRALFAASPPARWEAFSVRRGEFEVDAWLLLPPDFDPFRRYPVVLEVHGGPNAHYGYGFHALHQILASNGFLVVYANPRGSTSYGRDFTMQVLGDWGGEDYLDLMAVLDDVLSRPYADASRTAIAGGSYGGYMTAWAIGQSDRFRAAVCFAPCFNLVSMWGTSDIGYTFGEQQWRGAPHESPAWYAERSPSTYAHRARTPTLIQHGEEDYRCPIGQGEEMYVALRRAGCEAEFVRYPGASHLVQRVGPAAQRVDILRRALDWLTRHLTPDTTTD